jgi:Uma2 family endonuclease
VVAGPGAVANIGAVATLPVHHFDAHVYGRMVASGALDGEPVELLDGVLCEMSPQSPVHALIIQRLTRYFAGGLAWLRVQLPLEVTSDSVPEPDLALVEDEPSADEHPTSALVVVEIAVSSHAIDRGVKTRLYAAAGIPVYWLIDQPGRSIEVRTEPMRDGYRVTDAYGLGDTVPPPAAGVGPLEVASLLG